MLRSASETLKDTLNNYVEALNKEEDRIVKIEEVNIEEALKHVMHSLKSLIGATGTTINYDFSQLSVILFNEPTFEVFF
jgi:5'(3')-deoxyribonucleotidase